MDIHGIFNKILETTELYDIAYNAIFVLCNIRPSFLVQSIDYRENKLGPITLGPITFNILCALEEYLEIAKTYQGFIISNFNFSVPKELNDIIIGKLIGYPYAGDLHDEDKRNYLISIVIIHEKKEYEIMAVVCENKNLHEFQIIASKMQNLLDTFKICGKVDIKCKKLLHVNNIILKLKNNEKILEEENDEIIRLLKNSGFGILVKLNIDLYSKKNLLLKIIEDCFYELFSDDIVEYHVKILQSFNLSFTHEIIKKMHSEIYGKII